MRYGLANPLGTHAEQSSSTRPRRQATTLDATRAATLLNALTAAQALDLLDVRGGASRCWSPARRAPSAATRLQLAAHRGIEVTAYAARPTNCSTASAPPVVPRHGPRPGRRRPRHRRALGAGRWPGSGRRRLRGRHPRRRGERGVRTPAVEGSHRTAPASPNWSGSPTSVLTTRVAETYALADAVRRTHGWRRAGSRPPGPDP
ncbi:hypothetical protein [Streptomyces sp. KL116D]|uniref:hypothetical protein n=1 Tax=Streptomyces sp. KL116D TaxID=3045152 RepID=UPI0035560B57